MPDTQHIADGIFAEQEVIKAQNGKYEHKRKYLHGHGTPYEISVTEYLCPDGSDGIDVIFTKTLNTKKFIHVISWGAEKLDRELPWTEIKEDEY